MVPKTEWDRQDFLSLFLPFHPPDNLENQNSENLQKHIIILQMCTINENHPMYGFWDMEHKWHFFCHFRPFFCSFTPLITLKTKILKMYLLNANMHLIRIKKPHQLYLLSFFYIKCATKQCKYPKLIYSIPNKKAKTQIHKLQGDRQTYTDR